MKKDIVGFKGGGGKGGGGSSSSRTAVESPDSLRSRQYAHIIDLLSEGEVEGLATGDLKSVYYDKTPVLNSDGSANFPGVSIVTRNGTQNQSYISGFSSVEGEHGVNAQVLNGSPVVRSITSGVYDAARVTVAVPSLFVTSTKTGDTTGTTLDLKIELQSNGGSYNEVVRDTITGKTTTRYQKSYVFPLTGSPPWNIRVTRLTDDSTSQYLQNDLYFDSFTEITNAKLRYPNSALVASIIDSEQFQTIPTRGYDMKLLRIQIPVNATVRPDGSLTYSGTWDGTFKIAWCANPAWVFYDMVSNDRYGLGEFIDTMQIDKWALYQIGQYCDVMVPDGFGGFEPRFTCNLYLQEQKEAFQVIQDMASIFRGMVYWSSGLITAVQDAPADAQALFTNANVVDGRFVYSGSSLKTRHTVALVSWNDPDDFYILKPEYVEDAAGIARYGIIQTNIVAVGCTSRGQANRCGQWLLYSETNETETVSFKATTEGHKLRPGVIFNVQDRNRAGARRGGRVVSSTTTTLTVDKAFTPTPGITYTVKFMQPNGTIASVGIYSISGDVITFTTPVAFPPNPNAIWMVEGNDLALQVFRCVSVIETDDGAFEIAGLKHNAEKFDIVENGLVLAAAPISLLNTPPDAPTNVQITEALYQSGSTVKNIVTFAWGQSERADSYTVAYKVGDGNLVTIPGVRDQIFEVQDAPTGIYDVTVYAVSLTNKRSVGANAIKEVFGKTAKPADVTGFSISGISNGVAQLVWDLAPDLDVRIGGSVRIRHTPLTTGVDFSNMVDIGPALPGSATTASVPHIDGTYAAKFVDSSENSSNNAALIVSKNTSLINMNVVATIDESTFTGAKSGTIFPGTLGGLSLDYAGDFDGVPGVDALVSFDTFGGVKATGTYNFANTFDLGASYISRVSAAITALGVDISFNFDDRGGLIDDWASFDGALVDDVNAELQVRTTNDNPAGSPVWSTWRPFFIGQYTARAYQFRLILTSENVGHNIAITQLIVVVDMPDRTEAQSIASSGTGVYPVTFPASFKVTPAITVNAYNMGTGDYWTITGESRTGFNIQFKNAAGAGVDRKFDYQAKGYGYSI